MTALNNEHIELHRRVEKVLGRKVSAAAWEVVEEQRYVEMALSRSRDTGEEDLVDHLREVLRVVDAELAGVRRLLSAEEPSLSADVLARIEAVSRLAAEAAAGDEEVIRFRQRVLGRDTPMTPEEAETYLDAPESRQPRFKSAHATSRMERLDYQDARMSLTAQVGEGSPLSELRALAERLCASYPWEPSQAAAFVLEGLAPRATPFLLRLSQTQHPSRPRRARLVMEIDAWMPATVVLHAYREVQRSVLRGHNRPMSRRSIDLVNFVMQHRPATWQSLLDRWNNEHPDARYPGYRAFRFAYYRTRDALLVPRYRLYLGTDGST